MKQKLLPALAGGVLAGFLSGIPIIGILCFLWVILGSLLALFLYYRKVGQKIEIVDGLLVGGITGLVAGIFTIVESFLFTVAWTVVSVILSSGSTPTSDAIAGILFAGLFGLVFNLVWCMIMLVLSILTGLLFAVIAQSTNKPAQPVPFSTPGNYQ